MGTRADFYVGRGDQAEWLGSVAWDGYPDGIYLTLAEKEQKYGMNLPKHDKFQKGKHLFDSSTPQEFRVRVQQFFANRDDVTVPDMGWPWPWEDSRTTDFAYAFDGGKVWASCFGSAWYEPTEEPPEDSRKSATFPNMKARQNVTLGDRSGLIVVQGPK